MRLGKIFRLCSISNYATMLTLGLVFIYSNKKKTRCTSRSVRATSLAFYELEYTNYVGNIIPHAITSLM